MEDKTYLIDLTVDKEPDVELASINDSDLMKIRCFATHEGLNPNNFEFTRETLKNHYQSFLEKPVWIAPDVSGLPQGHAFDFIKGEFKDKDRVIIGHITRSYPVIVTPNGEIVNVDGYFPVEQYPVGELRVICELVVYKYYYKFIADNLLLLHLKNNLKFSMESICDVVTDEKGIKHSTSVIFTGLCIVMNPAFEHSTSLEVSEKKEDTLMDYEQMYKEVLAEKEDLIAENTTLTTEKTTMETELASIKNKLANSKVELAEKQNEIENLTPYKEKVELAEKEVLGETRLNQLSKMGTVVETAEDLSALTEIEFADKVLEYAKNYKPEVAAMQGVPVMETSVDGAKRLAELLSEIV